MEVPIINNLNDNGDRQRAKGKDVFKEQQKESEVNEVFGCARIFDLRARVCDCMCVCCCCWGAFRPAESVPSMQSGGEACMHACRQADTEVLFWQPAPINNPAVILQWCSVWGMQVVKCDCCCCHGPPLAPLSYPFTAVIWCVLMSPLRADIDLCPSAPLIRFSFDSPHCWSFKVIHLI